MGSGSSTANLAAQDADLIFEQLDTNKDNKLSVDELTQAAKDSRYYKDAWPAGAIKEAVVKYDADADGFLDKVEWKAAFVALVKKGVAAVPLKQTAAKAPAAPEVKSCLNATGLKAGTLSGADRYKLVAEGISKEAVHQAVVSHDVRLAEEFIRSFPPSFKSDVVAVLPAGAWSKMDWVEKLKLWDGHPDLPSEMEVAEAKAAMEAKAAKDQKARAEMEAHPERCESLTATFQGTAGFDMPAYFGGYTSVTITDRSGEVNLAGSEKGPEAKEKLLAFLSKKYGGGPGEVISTKPLEAQVMMNIIRRARSVCLKDGGEECIYMGSDSGEFKHEVKAIADNHLITINMEWEKRYYYDLDEDELSVDKQSKHESKAPPTDTLSETLEPSMDRLNKELRTHTPPTSLDFWED